MYRLVFLSGSSKGRRLAVGKGPLVIGSDPDCHVMLSDPGVEGRHAVLEEEADGVYIKGTHLSARLTVNGADVREAKLRHGDQVELGGTRFLYQLIQAAPTHSAKRRLSKFHGLAYVLILTILLVQLGLIAGLAMFGRIDPLPGPTVQADVAVEEPTTRESEKETALLRERLRSALEAEVFPAVAGESRLAAVRRGEQRPLLLLEDGLNLTSQPMMDELFARPLLRLEE